jgi:CheY-like chemotaxis protein
MATPWAKCTRECARRALDTAAGVLEEHTMAAATASPVGAKSVVIVDDDPALVEALSDLLHEEGYLVEAFTESPRALDRLLHGAPPSLVLLDYVMPGMNGLELLEALAASGISVQTVLFTAMSQPQLEMEVDVATVLRKPFDLDGLLSTIERLSLA